MIVGLSINWLSVPEDDDTEDGDIVPEDITDEDVDDKNGV